MSKGMTFKQFKDLYEKRIKEHLKKDLSIEWNLSEGLIDYYLHTAELTPDKKLPKDRVFK